MPLSDRDAMDQPPYGDDTPAPDVPDTATEHSATPEEVVEIALGYFAHLGFNEAKLEKIAKASGMSKRMIHYHFGDKKGLYIRTLTHALGQLRPAGEAMQLESAVPVEGVRKIVEAVYTCITEHPDAVRLLLLENLHDYGGMEAAAAANDESTVLLNLDKLLMLGQDAGAFRPGISAEDVLVLISSLGYFRISNQSPLIALYDLDLGTTENVDGMRRMVVDTVLAFLTSNLPATGSSSYLHVGGGATHAPPSDELYSFDTAVFED